MVGESKGLRKMYIGAKGERKRGVGKWFFGT